VFKKEICNSKNRNIDVKNYNHKKRIHWLSSEPTPYNDYLFDHLELDNEIDLVVHYKTSGDNSHPWKVPLAKNHIARFYKIFLGVDWHIISLIVLDKNAFFIVAGWDHLTSRTLLSILRIFRLPYAIWTDTPKNNTSRSLISRYLRSIWLRFIFSGANKIMGTGEPGLQALIDMGAPIETLVNFPFWHDITGYKSKQEIFSVHQNHPILIISSGYIDNKIKGHDIAIRALALVVQKQNMAFNYLIAGSGPDENNLKELICELGMENNIECVGWKEPEELKSLYNKANILIHPSPVHDPFPNAILEAMVAGLVVFGSNVSGSALDRIEHGINGFIHSAGNIEELSNQLYYLFQHKENIDYLSQHARLTAEKWPIERGIGLIKNVIGLYP